MSKFIKLLIIFFLGINLANAYSYINCNEDETVIIFFNGIGNTEDDALINTEFLQKALGDKAKDGTNLKYTFFYNKTINTPIDIIEAADQILRKQGSSLVERYESFNPFARDNEWNKNILETYKKYPQTDLEGINIALIEISQIFKRFLEEALKKSETQFIYDKHNKKLDELMKQGKKILFVGHSQGNLFASQAYEHAMIRGRNKNAIKVVYVAPPSNDLYGDYILSNLDIAINNIPINKRTKPNYFFQPFRDLNCISQACLSQKYDSLGHSFTDIYLNPELDIYKKLKN